MLYLMPSVSLLLIHIWSISDQFLSLVSCCMFTNCKTHSFTNEDVLKGFFFVCVCAILSGFAHFWVPICPQNMGSTHTHTSIPIIMMTFHRSNGFYSILYKLYILFPYTNPTPKPTLTEIMLFFFIEKKSPTRKRISDIAIWGTFRSHNIGFTWTTHTHVQNSGFHLR